MNKLSFIPYQGHSINYKECILQPIVKQGTYAEVQFVLCNDTYYVIKWNKQNTPYDKEENERYIQHLASCVGLSIPVVGLVYNIRKNKNGWIMPKLEINLFHDLFDLSYEQKQEARLYYINMIDNIIQHTLDKTVHTILNSIKKDIHLSNNLYKLGKIYNFKIKPFWTTYMKISPDIIYIKDSYEHAQFKHNALRASIELAKNLYHIRIQHNDLHTGNIMRDSSGKYYIIDFGLSSILLYDKPQHDLILLRNSIQNSIMKFNKDEEHYPVKFQFTLLQDFDQLLAQLPDQPLLTLYNETDWTVAQRNEYYREQVIEYILSKRLFHEK